MTPEFMWVTTVKDGVVKIKATVTGDHMVRVQENDTALVQDVDVDTVGPAVTVTVIGTSGGKDITIVDWRSTSKENVGLQEGEQQVKDLDLSREWTAYQRTTTPLLPQCLMSRERKQYQMAHKLNGVAYAIHGATITVQGIWLTQ